MLGRISVGHANKQFPGRDGRDDSDSRRIGNRSAC